jgi:DNA-binding NarL/FixJ family response regulator
MITVMIVDDHPVVRNGLEAMLSVEEDIEVSAAVEGGNAAVEWCAAHVDSLPDVIVTDVHMPKGDGFGMLATIRNAYPSVHVLLLAGMPLKDEENRARGDGASGYLPKSLDGQVLVKCIRRIAQSGSEFVTNEFVQNTGVLTDKELTVLQYASEGKTRDEIAIILGVHPETVKSHLKHIMAKLDTVNTTASVARGFELGLLRA